MHGAHYSLAPSAEEIAQFEPFMDELVALAFAVIRPLFLSGVVVDNKADASPVTVADREAERLLREHISVRFPGHGIVGEEFGIREGSRYRWILDPIDGTRAFISNCFLFGTLIALERDDGAGYRPILGCIAHAAAGLSLLGRGGFASGCTLRQADGSTRAVRVREARPLEQATVLMSTLPGSAEQGGARGVAQVVAGAGMARSWGDCFGYFAVATGGADVMLDPQLAYWDAAAIVPVIEGAGGRVSGWSGGDPLQELSLVASTGPLHEEVLQRIKDAK